MRLELILRQTIYIYYDVNILRMDKFDQKILNLLLKDGRMSYSQIADRVSLSTSACLRRIKALEQKGIIDGFSVRLNAKAMGQQIKAFITIRVDRHDMTLVEAFTEKIIMYPEVISCYQLTGETDFIAEICTHSVDSYTEFIEEKILSIPVVKDAVSFIVLKEIKPYQNEILR